MSNPCVSGSNRYTHLDNCLLNESFTDNGIDPSKLWVSMYCSKISFWKGCIDCFYRVFGYAGDFLRSRN